MRVFEGLSNGFDVKSPVVTIGTFDGVHLGHQKIIQQLNEEALKINGESVLFTFFPHPRLVLFPENTDLKLLQTRDEKIRKLERYGLKNIVMYPFSKAFSQLTADEFVRTILVEQMGVKVLVIGHDHQFGRDRQGGLAFLQKVAPIYGFDVIEIPAQEIEEVNVSSSKIRKAIQNGNIETASNYLTEPFEISGRVIRGKALGRTINFPTANLQIDSALKIIPKQGVYVVEVEFLGGIRKMGMMNIGNNPTVQDSQNTSLEVHLLDFEGDLYDETITVRFLRFLREEQKFENTELLKKQLVYDAQETRAFFSTLV